MTDNFYDLLCFDDFQLPKFQIRDDTLRSYDNCSDYMRFVEDDPSYMFEYNEFRRIKFPDLSEKIAAICGHGISFTDRKKLFQTDIDTKLIYMIFIRWER